MKHEQTPESELLRSLKERGNPFEAPPQYFEQQSKRMMELLDEEPEEEIPSFGERLADPFEAPEGYFARSPKAIMEYIDEHEAPIRSMRRFVFPAAIAAAIALLIALGWMTGPEQSGFSNPSDYFGESISDFSEQEMLALLDQEDVELGVLLEMMPEESILPEETISEEEDEALDALFEELDHSELESILMP
ncbi:MAG: hypothetical protein AAGM67_00735 [Bacteroidota bacterium]